MFVEPPSFTADLHQAALVSKGLLRQITDGNRSFLLAKGFQRYLQGAKPMAFHLSTPPTGSL